MTPVQDPRRLEDASQNLWWLGVILVIMGSLGNNLGNNLVSLGHKENSMKAAAQSVDDGDVEGGASSDALSAGPTEASRRGSLDPLVAANTTHTPTSDSDKAALAVEAQGGGDVVVVGHGNHGGSKVNWRTVGSIIFVVGALSTFAAFGFAAQSLLASLESIQFVSNVFFVRYVHKEAVTWRMIIATASIVTGNVLVVVFSDKAPALLTSTDMINLYATNSAYWGYLVCAMVLWFVNHMTYSHYYHARVVKRTLLWKHGFVEPFTFAVSSSIIGTQAVLNSKCLSMLIQVTSRGIVNEFERPHVWWILVTWIILVAYWLRRLDVGLAMFPPLFIIPVMQVFFVFFAILCGGVYFQEFVHFTINMYVGFIIGVVMILGGVYGLAPEDMEIITPPATQLDDKGPTASNSNSNSNSNSTAAATTTKKPIAPVVAEPTSLSLSLLGKDDGSGKMSSFTLDMRSRKGSGGGGGGGGESGKIGGCGDGVDEGEEEDEEDSKRDDNWGRMPSIRAKPSPLSSTATSMNVLPPLDRMTSKEMAIATAGAPAGAGPPPATALIDLSEHPGTSAPVDVTLA